MTTAIPRFGPTEVPKYNRIPFELAYFRDEAIETQRFQLLDRPIDIGAANRLLAHTTGDDSQSLAALINLITKYMDDKDGTGARWAPLELPSKKSEDPPVKRFRGPDGKIHAWEKAEDFLKHEAGSSRRRWIHLMLVDDDASVEEGALVKLLEFLVEVAGKGRTRA